MPLQNRVDPYGRLQAVAARGAWMGNRGVLHDASRRLAAPWRLRRWITCVLEFKDRHREVFAPNRYSELFFLDEATSLSAGHRPCAECRRGRYEEFRAAWTRGRRGRAASLPSAEAIDAVLHAERLDRDGEKRTYRASLSALPSGTMVEHAGRPHLWWNGRLRPWSFEGYGGTARVSSAARVAALTPRSTVAALRAGFVPQAHESAGG
ncbi:MAG TPA: hypothetical protein VMN82_15390 [Thermoanaerobaculia bacterium]|nr:hypothetical protein [Thermoanaerobaculia bacterium]